MKHGLEEKVVLDGEPSLDYPAKAEEFNAFNSYHPLFLDASIVLTEDTDSFIIGDRVWVGGTKPGQIAYIGETQFAPGEWAGVVLDEPVGQFLKKGDGYHAYSTCMLKISLHIYAHLAFLWF